MKKLYTLIILIACAITINAQTKTWVGPAEGAWNNADHWSPEGVPGSNTDVLIPSGSVVNAGMGAMMDTLTVEGGATLNRIDGDNMVMTRGFFQSGSVLNMYHGDLVSSGIIIDGIVNSIGPLTKGFWGGIIEVNNSMTIDADSGPFTFRENTLRINPTGTLNLSGDGIIDIAAFSGTLENQGLIQKTGGTGEFTIDVSFVNNGGTINVSSGDLVMRQYSILNDGVYNVSAGSSFIVTERIDPHGTLTGLLDGPFIIENHIVPLNDTATFNFTGLVQVEWAGGTLGSGDLINQSLITITGTAEVPNAIFGAIRLVNEGVIDIVSTEYFSIGSSCLLHNSVLGTINLLDSNVVSGGGGLLNEGLIRKAASGMNANIGTQYIDNDGGTIEVLGDTLEFAYNVALDGYDGIYNVSAGAALEHDGSWNIQGVSTGQLDGPLMLTGGGYSLPALDTAVFNFTGFAQVDWYNGTFSGGNLKNMGVINAKSITGYANQVSSSHIINEGLINVNGLHGIYMYAPSTILNTATGVIDIQVDNFIYCGAGVTNLGLFKKSGGTGVSPITSSFFNNYPGLVLVEVGTLDFNLLEPGDGDFAGAGTLDLSSFFNPYVIQGGVSPGNSPGTLSIIGNYTSSPTAMLNIELNGNNAGVDFDVLAIEDAAILKGGINLTMGFAPAASEQFEIVTAMSVDSCLLPATVSAVFDGETYTYDVICNADNVTLGLISVGLDDLSSERMISVYPNPMSQLAKVNLGEALSSSHRSSLVIINRLGQIVRSIQIPQGAESIDLARGNLPSGLYHVQLVDDAQVKSSFKLLIK